MPKNETFRSIQLYNTVTYMHILGNGAKWEWKIVIIISKQRKGTNISWANYKNSKYFMYTKYGNILGTARVFKTIVYNGRLVRHFICCGDRVKYCVVEAYIAVFEHPITYIFCVSSSRLYICRSFLLLWPSFFISFHRAIMPLVQNDIWK